MKYAGPYLITNGDLNTMTQAIVVERADELDLQVECFIARTGTPRDQVTVNPLGDPIDPVSKTTKWLIEAGLA